MKYLSSISSDNCDVTFVNGTFTGDLTVDTNTLYVDSTNNRVGIGTSSPSAKLHIEGDGSIIRLQNNNSDTNGTFIDFRDSTGTRTGYVGTTGTSDDMFLFTQSAKPIRFYTNSSERMRLTSGGNVGIGETSVDARLHITSSGAVVNQKFESSGVAAWRIGIPNGQTYFAFDNTTDALTSPKVAIASSGNVGIGTTSPSRNLHIHQDDSTLSYIQITNSTTGTSGSDGVSFGITSGEVAIWNNRENTATAISTNNTERMRITSGGNVLIGTTTDSGYKLDVSGNVRGNNIYANDSSVPSLYMERGDGNLQPVIRLLKSNDNLLIGHTAIDEVIFYDDAGEAMRLDGSGNLGIGTTSPAQKLDVNGSINIGSGIIYIGQNTIDGSSDNLKISADSSNISGASTIEFLVDGSEKARIDNSGNVGIGTSSPSKKLDVNGEVGGTNIYAETYRSNRVDGDIYIQAATATDFVSIGTQLAQNLLRVQGDGNVGIGTSSPSDILSINSSSSDTIIHLTNTSTGTTTADGLRLGMVGTNAYFLLRESASMLFHTNNTERMRITNGGNVLIGTTTDSGATVHIRQNSSGQSPINSPSLFIENNGGSNSYYALQVATQGGGYSFNVTNAGNVGIGTNSPSAKLQISSGNNVDTQLLVGEGSTYGAPSIRFKTASTNYMGLGFTTGSVVGNEVLDAIAIQRTGNVGIGTTSPTSKTHVYYGGGTTNGLHVQASANRGKIAVSDNDTAAYMIAENSLASFGRQDALSANNLNITSGGNVLIGTTTDSGWPLQVKGSTNIAYFRGDTGYSDITFSSPVANEFHMTFGGGDALVFNSTTNERMRLTSGGNVGIGTNSPVTGLDVRTSAYSNTTARFGETRPVYIINNEPIIGFNQYYDSGWKAGGSGYSGYIGMKPSNGDMYFRLSTQSNAANAAVAETTPLYILNNGNVGIGTSSPAQKLHVSGRTRVDQNAQAFDLVGTDHVYSAWYPRGTSGGRKAYMGYAGASVTDFTAMNQDTGAFIIGTNNAERMRIISSGNVGIGTSSPDQKLHVSGNAKVTGVFYTDYVQTLSGTSIDFRHQDASVVMRVDTANARVGIGTTAPSATLHVNGSSGGTATFQGATQSTVNLLAGAANNYLVGTTTGDISLRPNGSAAVTLKANGLVGIGTASPDRQLQVHESTSGTSTAKFTNSTTGEDGDTGFFVGINGSEQPILFGYNSTDMVIGTNGTERMRITSAGNVGIGTTSPANILDIDDGAVSDVRLRGNQTTDARLGAYNFYNTAASDTVAAISADRDGADDAGALAFDTQVAGGGMTERMRITSTGNVGIGTSSPIGLLTVQGDDADIYLRSNDYTIARIINRGSSGTNLDTGLFSLMISDGTNNNVEAVRLDAGGNSWFNGGNVGIGTTSPLSPLHVKSNSQQIAIDRTDGQGALWRFYSWASGLNIFPDSAKDIFIGRDGSTTNLQLHNGILRVLGTGDSYFTGNLGIGTTSPTSKLHVVGDFFLKGSDTSSSTKNFQVQTGNGTSIMDFRNDAYAFFGCGQGGGSASGFIFRYNSTFGVQFTGYNYGNGTSPSYKPILMDTDLAGRSQGVYVNYGITGYTAPAPTSNTEFAVRGRGTSSQFTAKFEDSSTNPLLYIKDNGNVMVGTSTDSGHKLDVEGNTNTNGDYYVNGTQGWSGTININTNPPVAITVEGGIITNVT